jgi:hypothetical protein
MIRVSVDFVFVGVGMSIPISAALGIKRGLDDTHSRSESAGHIHNHMIVADQEAVLENLGRDVPIAQMPCNLNEVLRYCTGYLGQRFLRSAEHHPFTSLQYNAVTVSHHGGFREVEQEIPSAVCSQP